MIAKTTHTQGKRVVENLFGVDASFRGLFVSFLQGIDVWWVLWVRS